MNDLFAPPALTRETFSARKLSLVPVRGDVMSPTLRGDWDYVLAAPVTSFLYDSLYVVDQMGAPCVYRCQSVGTGKVRMAGGNPHYSEHYVPADWFNEHVLGIVVFDLKVRDPQRMQAAWEAGQ